MAIAVSAIAISAGAAAPNPLAQTLPPVPTQTQPAARPAAPQIPHDPIFPNGGQSFRFFAANGTLMELESAKAKKESSGRIEYCFLPGETSPVMLRNTDDFAFASLVHGSPKDIERWNTIAAPKMALFTLEYLAVADGKRYATKKYIPMNGLVYGNPLPNINPKKPNYLGQLYISRPPTLPLGEYAITIGGMFPFGECRGSVSAFRIIQ